MHGYRIPSSFLIIFLMSTFAFGIAGADELADQVHINEQRMPLANDSQKLVDNEGNGDPDLYGTRNFRVVLNGIQYRGGANNYYLQPTPRSNLNPLPTVGLENLCKMGFKTAIYLYTTNFASAPKIINCVFPNGTRNTLHYQQITATAAGSPRKILKLLYQSIKFPALGPTYTHCWNGWHASGLASALALRQFCGFTPEEAVNYWTLNTDGMGDGPGYESIRSEVRDFIPFPDLQINDSERELICPKHSQFNLED